jgi:tripartite ATP-independent transporter DctM subunit
VTDIEATIVLIAALFLFLGTGIWIGLSLLGVALVALWLFTTRPAGDAMATTIFGAASSWTLTALPLFIWMGEILFRTRLSQDMFRGLAPWLTRLPGRLVHVNVIGCAIFAAISGSSAATCATIGKMTIPELKKRGYPDDIALGSLAGSGTLGLLIPPSIIMIVYGVAAEVSIAKLFIAGVLPGIMLAGLFMLYVAGWSLFNPSKIPPNDIHMSFGRKVWESRHLIPVVLLIGLVLGSIYTGVATATESAALGVVGALILAIAQGSMSLRVFWDSVMGATRTSCMIALILAGSSFLSLAMGFTGLPRHLAEWIATMHLSPGLLILALTLFFILLGCFIDGISMVVLTIAILLPVVQQAGFDLIWFGIFVVLVVEMAQITPPVGFNLFVLQGMTGYSIFYIGRIAFPYFLLMVVAVTITYFVPDVVNYLPAQMSNTPR